MPLAASSGGSNPLTLLLPLLLIVGLYFLMIRPQQRRNREMREMQASLGPGDEVLTSSGIHAEVVEIDESEGTVVLEISPGVRVTFARAAIGRVVRAATHADEADAGHGPDADEPDDETDAEVAVYDSDPVKRRAD